MQGMDPTDGALWYGGGATGRTPDRALRFLCGGYLFW